MTNFQRTDQKSLNLITPERAVLVLPIAAGIAVALLSVFLGVIPLGVAFNNQLSRVKEMEKKVVELPIARSELDQAIRQYKISQEQQNRLLNLLSGTSALRTWLTAVNELANTEQVGILKVEPQPRQLYVPPSDASKTPSSTPVQPATSDPLLVPNVEKRSAVITFQGSFPRILSLLRRIELLESIVVASNMELEFAPVSSPSSSASKSHNQTPLTRLKLKFSAYGRK